MLKWNIVLFCLPKVAPRRDDIAIPMNDSPTPNHSAEIAAELFFVEEGSPAEAQHSFSDSELTLDGPVEKAGWHVGQRLLPTGGTVAAKDTLWLGELGRNALVSYFSSYAFPGVGEATAKKIVESLDRGQLISMLRGDADIEVSGVSKDAVAKLVSAWKERQGEHAWSILMHELKFTPQQQVAAREKLGARVIPLLKENPFDLLGLIPRLDFGQAANLCIRFGIDLSDEEKTLAGTNYWLEDHMERQRRNTCGSLERAVREVSRITGLGTFAVRQHIADSGKALHFGNHNDKPMVSTLRSAARDAKVADQLQRLILSSQGVGDLLFDPESLETAVELSGEQQDAIGMALRNPVSIVTGGPGAGKTAMVQGLVNALRQQGKKLQICAPTGRAAKRIAETPGLARYDPSTIHMYLTRNEDRAVDLDFMVVDESSMIDIDLMLRLLRSIPDGCSVVFIGDANQLPPVGPGQPFKDMIEADIVPVARLTGNFRQDSHSDTIKAAHAVINGNVPIINGDLGASDFVFLETPEPEQSDTIMELYFDVLPSMLGNDVTDNQILAPQRTRHVGVTRLNALIQSRLHSDKTPVLTKKDGDDEMVVHVGDKVINRENNYQLGVMNGDIGTVSQARGGNLTVRFETPEGPVRDVEFTGREKYNLDPAYALTIHKSQGSEYPGVIIPVTRAHISMLSRSLLYTAITRGQSKVCLVGEQQALEQALEWYTKDTRHTLLVGELTGAFRP